MNCYQSRFLRFCFCVFFFTIPIEKNFASDYYFSSTSGDDSRSFELAQSSSTPWQSIEKLNEISSSLKGGDRIFFKRGDVFHGTIRLSRGGLVGNQILFDAFGTGNLPIITSLMKVEDWENVGNGVYQTKISNLKSSYLKVVLIDNEIKAFGRYPNLDEGNKGYLTIQSVNNDFSINGNSIPFNGKGGEIVIRKNDWIIDSYTIKNSNEGTIDFLNRGTSGYKPIKGFGYFIQNHIATLDQPGEWAYSAEQKTLSVYFGKMKPSDIVVEYATNDYLLVTNFLVRNLSFRNLHFKGSNKNIVNIEKSSNILVENCVLENAGENAVYSYSTPDFTLMNNTIRNALSGGIFFWHSTPRAIISDNLIENSMPFQGMAKNSDLNGIGIYLAGNANDSKVLRNSVINSGYNGIHFGGNNSIVRNNFVKNYCLWKQDGGGIYMNSDGLINTNNIGREIIGNIVIGGAGAKEGTEQEFDLAEGIYLDDNTQGVYVAQNTVAHINGNGIYLHNANNIKIIENLIYDCSVQLKLNHDHLGGPLRNITIEGNQFSSIKENEISFSISSIKADLDQFGISRANYFLDPYRNEFIFESKSPDNIGYGSRRNFKNWSETYGLENSSNIEVTNLKRLKIIDEKIIKQSNFNSDISLVSGVYHAFSKKISSGIDGGTWEITPNANESALAFIQIGPIVEKDEILVELDVKSEKDNQSVEMFLENSFNKNQIEAISYFDASQEKKHIQLILNSLNSSSNESLVFRIASEPISIFIDNLKVSRVTTERNKDQMFFQFNFSEKPADYSLSGIYKDAKGQLFEDSVTILPYSSILLVRID